MSHTVTPPPRRADSLTRETIIDAAIDLLDTAGEGGLTFRALAARLATGAGAIYWHVADKDDLFTAASDAIVARAMDAVLQCETPQAGIRAVALAMFEAMDAHPWLGSALSRAPGQLPTVRILERLGRQVDALGVPQDRQWLAACTLLNYLLGVSGQNAANAAIAREKGLERAHFLDTMAGAWSRLDAQAFPFARKVAGQLRAHDDREDFLAGIDLIVHGMQALQAGR
ncbi:TetR/AcrR family transcriptional regulator [Janthinobacterium lividum]|uniref:TetR family transcriptional regulator n=1 Tax=Janthinobacterium lividum TaxID=29581 RepID=A0AAJ4MNN9_9BURK|nr:MULTISPECIES: TetR family transcriptional regulator [Janthinobacterium]KAB0325154.1 TetR family transcriptional regulator [Janthinobacterium lividum]QSX94244.1 TetR family transcriptional regulator [Janthinobacterium lividum]UGQ34013.1 TetR family transcriptional regulator [Janthinobacterium sp. PLB04]